MCIHQSSNSSTCMFPINQIDGHGKMVLTISLLLCRTPTTKILFTSVIQGGILKSSLINEEPNCESHYIFTEIASRTPLKYKNKTKTKFNSEKQCEEQNICYQWSFTLSFISQNVPSYEQERIKFFQSSSWITYAFALHLK